MGALSSQANFVSPLLIAVIQVYNDHCHTQISKELHVALDGWLVLSWHMFYYACFTAMSRDGQEMSFHPFPS